MVAWGCPGLAGAAAAGWWHPREVKVPGCGVTGLCDPGTDLPPAPQGAVVPAAGGLRAQGEKPTSSGKPVVTSRAPTMRTARPALAEHAAPQHLPQRGVNSVRSRVTGGFSTVFYYKDRLRGCRFHHAAVRAPQPRHVPKVKNMVQRARGPRQHYKPTSFRSIKVLP